MTSVLVPHVDEMSVNTVLRSLLLLVLSCGTPGNTVKNMCNTGKAQSPVDIKTKDSIQCGSDFKPLLLSYYYGPFAASVVTNTGATVRITIADSARDSYVLKGGPLKGEYVFAELHFHWGKNDREGNEHTINSNRYSMEAHMVHYKKIYGSSEEALEHDDGLAVIAFFLQARSQENKDLRPLIDAVTNLTRRNATISLHTEDALDWALQAASKGKTYFSYAGSLTTPPCAENVSWMVFKDPIKISSKQLEVFRKLKSNGKDITPNFRKTYPLNGRIIRHCTV